MMLSGGSIGTTFAAVISPANGREELDATRSGHYILAHVGRDVVVAVEVCDGGVQEFDTRVEQRATGVFVVVNLREVATSGIYNLIYGHAFILSRRKTTKKPAGIIRRA